MLRKFPALTATAAVLVTAVLHGLWTDRWASAAGATDAAARLEEVPLVLGEWHGQPLEQGPRQSEPLAGYLYRRYVHARTGAVVTVALVGGRPGPVCIHTPEVCYPGNGYELTPGGKHTVRPGGELPPADFWTASLRKTRAAGQTNQRIFWAWGAAGRWGVSDYPRLAFAHHRVLYKLYVIHELPAGAGGKVDDDPSNELIRLLLPELQRTLFTST